jgi:hypothetical protein
MQSGPLTKRSRIKGPDRNVTEFSYTQHSYTQKRNFGVVDVRPLESADNRAWTNLRAEDGLLRYLPTLTFLCLSWDGLIDCRCDCCQCVGNQSGYVQDKPEGNWHRGFRWMTKACEPFNYMHCCAPNIGAVDTSKRV